MKTTFLILFAIALIAHSAKAQTPLIENSDIHNQLQYGFKVGSDYATAVDLKGESFKAKPVFGILSGIFAAIPLRQYFGLQPEALFAQKGFRGKGTVDGYNYELTRTASYLDFPLYFSYKPNQFLAIMAGPEYSLFIQQDDKFKTTTDARLLKDQYNNDKIRKSNFSLTGGFEFYLKSVVLGMKGGIDLQNNNGAVIATPQYYRNIWCQATIGYSVHL